jgi:hypothetical protein
MPSLAQLQHEDAAYVGPPEDFRVDQGPRSGSLQVEAARKRGAIADEIHVTRDDPELDEGWKQALIVPISVIGG